MFHVKHFIYLPCVEKKSLLLIKQEGFIMIKYYWIYTTVYNCGLSHQQYYPDKTLFHFQNTHRFLIQSDFYSCPDLFFVFEISADLYFR